MAVKYFNFHFCKHSLLSLYYIHVVHYVICVTCRTKYDAAEVEWELFNSSCSEDCGDSRWNWNSERLMPRSYWVWRGHSIICETRVSGL